MNPKEKKIPLSKLVVNPSNDRFVPVEDELQAINKMLEIQGDKIYKLAQHILSNGLSPKPFYVIEKNGKYLVHDGNRRTTALKIMRNPKLINDRYENLKKRFIGLNQLYKNNPIKKVNCCIFQSLTELDIWVKLEHTGEQNGIGTVPWNTEQIERFNERKGHNKKIERQALDFLRDSEYVTDEVKELANVMSLTNFSRFINDKFIRDSLGLEVANNKLFSYYGEEELSNILARIVTNFSDKSFKVSVIYDANKRKKYFETIRDIIPPLASRAETPWEVEHPLDSMNKIEEERTKETDRKNKMASKPKEISHKRNLLIPKNCLIPISNPKVSKIYEELKNLDTYKFSNCSAVTLRVFIELSVDTFLEKKELLKEGDVSAARSGLALFNKVIKVSDYLSKKKIIDEAIAKPIKIMAKDANSIWGIDTLHSYVHNNRMAPIPDNIITTWDNIQDFMVLLWQEIEKE